MLMLVISHYLFSVGGGSSDLPCFSISLANFVRPTSFRTAMKVAHVTGSLPPPRSHLDRMLCTIMAGDLGSEAIMASVLEPVSSFNNCVPRT